MSLFANYLFSIHWYLFHLSSVQEIATALQNGQRDRPSRKYCFLFMKRCSPNFSKMCNAWRETDFSRSFFFEKFIVNFLFIENRDFGVFFIPYILPQFSKWKAAVFCILFFIYLSKSYWKLLLMCNSVFELFHFLFFFQKKIIIILPVL